MKKHWIALAVFAAAVAAWAPSASAVSSPQTFSLLEVSIPSADRPLGNFTFDRPPAAGDQFTVTNALYKWAGAKRGARAGHDEVLHTFMTGFGAKFSHPATVLFLAQVYLHGGTMLLQGFGQVNPNGPSKLTFPIVGGTGIYANARGYVNVRNLSPNTTNVEFHLLP